MTADDDSPTTVVHSNEAPRFDALATTPMHPALPLLTVLPGWCLLPPDVAGRLRLPFVLATSVVVSTIAGLVLTAVGIFDPWLVLAVEAPLLAIPIRARRMTPVPIRTHLLALAATMAVAVVAWLTAGEPFDANGDGGVYTIAAAHIADSGSWAWDLDGLLPGDMPLALATRRAPYAVRWTEVSPGFLVRGNVVAPQFLPAYPVWGALAAVGDHLDGPLTANLVGVLLLLVCGAELARRLVRGPAAAAVPVAIAASPMLLVFAKNPTAEVVLAGLLAAWLLAADVALRRADRRWALVAGSLLAVAVMTKFFAWAVLGLAAIHLMFQRGPRLALAPRMAGPAIVAGLAASFVAGPHLHNHLRQIMTLDAFLLAVAAVAVAVAIRTLPAGWTRPLPTIVAVAGTAGFGWLGMIRPTTVERGSQNDLIEMAVLVGPLLLIGAVIGWAAWTATRRRPWHSLPALVWVGLTLFVAIGSGDSPVYPFAARRIVPITLPLGVIMWASLVGRWRRLHSVAAIAAVVLPVGPALWTQGSAVLVRPGDGFRDTLAAFRRAIPDDSMVIAFGQSHRYVPHLTLLEGRRIPCAGPDSAAEVRELRSWVRRRSDVLLLTDEWRESGRIAEVWEQRTGLASVRTPPLVADRPRRRRFLLARPSDQERWMHAVLDVGRDDLLRVGGLYPPEAVGDRTARWSGRRAWVLIPDGDAVRFRWSPGGHPDRPVTVRVAAQGTIIGRLEVGSGWSTSRWLPLPPGRWQHVLVLSVPTFVPDAVGVHAGDLRQLGVLLDRVEVRPRSNPDGDG